MRYAVDTSVAIPLVVRTHPQHEAVAAWAAGRTLCLSGHAAVETYAVLTRLPAGVRATPEQALQVMDENFAEVLALRPDIAASTHRVFARQGIAGGATYDALVALAATENGLTLVTRDLRARDTYDRMGATVSVLGQGCV